MRIAVAIASRGRPAALAGVITSAWRLQSGRHELCFVIGNDEDDTETQRAIDFIHADTREGIPLIAFPHPRQPSLGDVQNRILLACKGSDVVTLLSDRAFVVTPGWDDALAAGVMQYPDRVLWWSSPSDPDLTMPIIPEKIGEAMDWTWAVGPYVFWFTDTHWVEVDGMVAGGPSLRTPAAYAGGRAATTRGRDFEFWIRVFIALRPKRIEQAKEIAARLGKPWQDPPPEMLAHFAARDQFQLENAANFEQRFADPNPPGPEYLEAKAKAEKILEEMNVPA